MRMLSDSDLHAIGAIMDEKIQAHNVWIDKKFDEKLEPVLEAIRDGFGEMDRQWDAKLAVQKHELMDHTDRTVSKEVGDLRVEMKGDIGGLRSELRERDLIG